MPCLFGHYVLEVACRGGCGRSLCPVCYPGGTCGDCRPHGIKRPYEEGTSEDDDDHVFKKRKISPEEPRPKEMGQKSRGFAPTLFQWSGEPNEKSQLQQNLRRAFAKRVRRGRSERRSTVDFMVSREVGNSINLTSHDHYAFIHKLEQHANGGLIVYFECTTVEWMHKAWGEIVASGAAIRLNEILLQRDFRKDFFRAYQALDSGERLFLHALYVWFLNRVIATGDEAPAGFFEVVLPQETIEELGLFENEWFTMTLIDGAIGDVLQGRWTELSLFSADDPPPRDRWLVSRMLGRVPEVSGDALDRLNQQALKMLHFPRSAPDSRPLSLDVDMGGDGFGDMGDELMEGVNNFRSRRAPDTSPPLFLRARAWLEALGARVRGGARALGAAVERWLDSLSPPWGGGLLPAYAGAAIPGTRAGDGGLDGRPPIPPALAYVGGDGGNPGGGNQPANPMVKGQHPHDQQPFLGVIDIGQGNCNALFDNQGRAFVYYDMGYRKNGADPPRGHANLCLCHDPLIILSHWDIDHVSLARHHPRCFGLTWIVPQQHMGTGEAREIVARTLRSGGRLFLWEDRQGFMTFPWGFLVRGDRDDVRQFSSKAKNDTGLAMYVCVKDDPVPQNTAAASQPAPCPEITVGVLDADELAQELNDRTGGTVEDAIRTALRQGEIYHRINQALVHAAAQGADANVRAMIACLVAYLMTRDIAVPGNAALLELGTVTWANRAAPNPRTAIVNAVVNAGIFAPNVFDAAAYLAGVANRRGVQGTAGATATDWLGLFNNQAMRVSDTFFAPLVDRSGAPVVVPPDVPRIQQAVENTHPPFTAGERFLLSSGDCAYNYLKPQRYQHRPVVVGLAAFHHGANGADGQTVIPSTIPWAPDSAATRAMARIVDEDPPAALRAAMGAALSLGDWPDLVRAVRAYHEAREAHQSMDVAVVYAAAKLHAPALTADVCRQIFDQAGVAGQHATPGDVLANLLWDPNDPALQCAARAALGHVRAAAGIDATEVHDEDLLAAIERALRAAVPTGGGGEIAKGAITATAGAILEEVRESVNADVPTAPKIRGALAGAANADPAPAQVSQFTAAIYATIAAAHALAANAAVARTQALTREEDATRAAIVLGAAAGGAVGAAEGAADRIHEAMIFSMLAGFLSARGRSNAQRASGLGVTPGDRVVYTFGTGNSYDHPMERALDKYRAHGWSHRLDREGRDGGANHDFAIGWEVEGNQYEGPLRADVNRVNVCGCGGVKQFRVT